MVDTSLAYAYSQAATITNDLKRLIPLGTLYTVNNPIQPFTPLEAPDDWKWFDPPYLSWNVPLVSTTTFQPASFSPLLIDLCYLIQRFHIKITYKRVKSMICLRIYIVPCDMEGMRFCELVRSKYRSGKSVSWHTNKFRQILQRLLSVLDYDSKGWETGSNTPCLILSSLRDYEDFDLKDLGTSVYFRNVSDFNSHIVRLLRGQKFHYNKESSKSTVTLEERLRNIYNSVAFGDNVQEYYEQVSQIKDLKSTLYKYQVESIAKMALCETKLSKLLMPNLLAFTRFGRTYYFDSVDILFKALPEFYQSPRGGILAENMGLGKTLICLSLILLTKFEVSEVPDEFVIRDTRDFKVLPLVEQCVRVINRHSVPWKNHLNDVPESCINILKSKPGSFYFKRLEQVHPNSRKNSRSKPIVREENLLLCTTTLVVVPDNLFNQWSDEIEKHVLPSSISVLKLPKSSRVPSALILTQYDLVLITYSTFVADESQKSPLNKVYWKRFIIDEGHSMNQRTSRLVELSKNLKFERKWIVSGTPTSGLTKLHMNENDGDKSHLIKRKFDAKSDLAKLGYLISNFFGIRPWSTDLVLWNKHFVKPLVDDAYGASSAFLCLVDSLTVRHSLNEIESDVRLPSLYHKPVYLSPSYYNKISINLFTAVLAINAVSSEREGKDYMFDQTNKQELRKLVTNLQRSTFHWTAFSTDDLNSMISFAKVCMGKKNPKDSSKFLYSDSDRELLNDCIKFCDIALKDSVWRIVSNIHEMTFFVDNKLGEDFHSNFGIGKTKDGLSVFGAPQLFSAQRFFYKNRFSRNADVFYERISKSSDEFWSQYWKELKKKKNERIKNDGKAIQLSNNKKEFGRKHYQARQSAKFGASLEGSLSSKILGTASAKLSYMCSRLLEHQMTGTKSLVFFEFEDSAYYLTEALDLLGIDYIMYSTSIRQSERFQKIQEFSDQKGGICLIMDLKLASFGLTITAATRVYFLNPVWNRSVEAQAIKRAHRIGQLRDVYVESLVLKGTLEEEMFNKRFMKGSGDEIDELRIPVADDQQIRDYITRFSFLKTSKDEDHYSAFKSENVCGLDSINYQEFEENELMDPIGFKSRGSTYWDIPVFSKMSQTKVSGLEMKVKAFASKVLSKDFDTSNNSPVKSSGPQEAHYDGESTESEEFELIMSDTNPEDSSRKRLTFAMDDDTSFREGKQVKKVRF